MTSSTPEYPAYQFVPTSVVANGETLAKQYRNRDGSVVTDISLPQDSVERKTKLQKLLNEYETSVDTFSPEFMTQFESVANAKKQAALNSFTDIYEPAMRKSREDYFSRLGTLDSTAYLDRYNALEKTKANAYSDIANDYIANLDELKNNELNRRYNYINYLQSGLNALNAQNNNYINTLSSLSSSYTNNYNNYLNNMYSSQMANSKNNNLFDSALSLAGGVFAFL